MIKRFFTNIIFLVNGILLYGQQPVAISLDHNPALLNRPQPVLKRTMQADTVNLPFVDDFSYYDKSPYPDQSLWMDNYVFVNNNYPVEPRSNGTATFDALDANGKIYNSPAGSFPADTLTSCPINLGDAGTRDVYLSFFYQPQGYGDNPEVGDSLILQFKKPSKEWKNVWEVPGTTLHPFKQVLVAVQDEYLYKGFQFRFVNMVSLTQDKDNPGLTGNADHWNIDYVRLDKNRHENDTTISDVAMTAPIQSMIKGYRSIPWKQLEFAEKTNLEPKMTIVYGNNDSVAHLVGREFEVTDTYRGGKITVSGGSENIAVDETVTFGQDILNPFISPAVDSALFELKSYLVTGNYDRRENDTVRFYQNFSNYFARDDGIPESGYGYREKSAGGCAIACRYETFAPDSIRAVRLYFNPTVNDTTKRYVFKIAVWRDDNGRPGEQIYLSAAKYSPQVFGQFTTYILEKPLYVTKYYWIGWRQETSGFLNVGFDRNHNDKGNLWYDGQGSWKQDFNDGTLMIRPVFGNRSDFPTSSPLPETVNKVDLKIYPNPASQYIQMEINTSDVAPAEYTIEIYRQTGQLCYRAGYTGDNIDVSRFVPGLYMVRLVHRKSGYTQTQKILINR